MAKRLNTRHQEMVREKIRASCIIKALDEHLHGKRDMLPSQVAAAKILLDKSVSNAPNIVIGPGQEGQHALEMTLTFR